MKIISWLILVAVAAGIGFAFWRWRRLEEERGRTAEERLKSFVAQAAPATQTLPAAQAMPLVDAGSLQQQKLLLEAASGPLDLANRHPSRSPIPAVTYPMEMIVFVGNSGAGVKSSFLEQFKELLERARSSRQSLTK